MTVDLYSVLLRESKKNGSWSFNRAETGIHDASKCQGAPPLQYRRRTRGLSLHNHAAANFNGLSHELNCDASTIRQHVRDF
jgi:hypothetical protein